MKRFCIIIAATVIGAVICWSLFSGNPETHSSTHEIPAAKQNDSKRNPSLNPRAPGDSTTANDLASNEATTTQAESAEALANFEAAREAAELARTPKGIWTQRRPAIDDYAAAIPAEHKAAFADFRAQYPGLDPSDVRDFNAAYMKEFTRHGDTLNEASAKAFNAWLEPMMAMQRAAVTARAALVGVAVRSSEPMDLAGNSRTHVLAGFDGVTPRYYHTVNAAAAESTGANLVRFNSSYDPEIAPPADGTGFYVNVNDVGLIHEHPEFQLPNNGGSRILYKDSYSSNNSHATHVAGTIGCWGYDSNLMGMAPRVWLRSFEGFYFNRGVSSHGMMWPGQKHSATNPRTGEAEMKSVVSSASMITGRGGRYTQESVTMDTGLSSYPYVTYFFGAGNDGAGYATVASDQTSCKNGVTIGSVEDVVRDENGAYVSGGRFSGFSSRGPTVDGRIKPDLMANGAGLRSTWSASSTASKSGTSMATPNASGSTALLIDYIHRKLPGHFFRSSTIKALLLNTATDRGKSGPDYIYGFGIVNVKAACDTVKRYAENPSSRVVLEDTLSSGQTWTQTYTYDGNGPVRLTLAWIDPAGAEVPYQTVDLTPRLVNDLNVRLIGPDGSTTYEPFVMPFTTGNGTYPAYDVNLHNATAVTGNNFTDNNEQILVANPPAGTYTVKVSHAGSLKNDEDQRFSLVVSGLSGDTAINPNLSAISPDTAPHIGALPNNFVVTLDGSGFMLGTDVILRRSAADGATEEHKGHGIIPVSNQIIARFNIPELDAGYWDVVARTPDGTETTLPNGFLVPARAPRVTLYANDFESGSNGLTLGSGWSLADPDKGNVSGPADAQQGSKALVTYAGGNYPGSAYQEVQTPYVSTIGYTDLKVEFQRWLGVRSGDNAEIWYSIGFSSSRLAGLSNVIDTGWSAQSYNISRNAEGRSSFGIRFQLDTNSTDHSFGWNIDDLKITAAPSSFPVTYPPVISSSAITSATQGQPYSYSITTSDADTAGSSLVLAATGLPDGLTFTPNGSGGATLSGTPTGTGIFPITISVTDGDYTTYQNFSIACVPVGGNNAPVITTSTLPDAFIGEAYSSTITATDADGHSLTLSLNEPKPNWLSFTDNGDNTATLSGTPPVDAQTSYSLEVAAFDGFDTTTANLTLSIQPRAIVGFSAATASINEAAGTISLTVTRADNSTGPVTLSYSCSNGSAGAGDYSAVTNTLSWDDGDQSSRSIDIPILQDSISELNETFTVTLSSLTGIASFGTSVATVTIEDDDPVLVTVAVTDGTCVEDANDGSFTLTRTGPTNAALTVNYSLSGTATNGTDYAQLNGTVNIPAGAATAEILIAVTADTDYEGDESVTLTLESGSGYAPGGSSSDTITIQDNDKPTVSVAAAASSVSEDVGTTSFIFTRSGITTLGPLTVNFAVAGTATSGDDYQALSSSVVIPQSQSQATVTVNIINDSTVEVSETIILSVSPSATYDIANAPTNSAVVTILDDEPNNAPTVDAGPNQYAVLIDGAGGGDPLTGAHYEWDASKDTGGNNLWPSTGANNYGWQFTTSVTPSGVSDPRFNTLSLAYDFPAARSVSQTTLENSIDSTASVTWEFVLQTDAIASDGLIMESGGGTDGIQIWLEGGSLKAQVRDNGTPATLTYPLSEDDKSRFIHVVFVVDMGADLVSLYVDDGAPITASWTGADWCGNNDAGLGIIGNSAPDGSPTDFNGRIALIRCYQSAFSAAEVTTNFRSLSLGAAVTVTLAGTVDDPDGPTLTTTWSLESSDPADLSVIFADASSLNTDVTFTAAGTYVLRLTADDGANQVSDFVTITVLNSPPTAYTTWIGRTFANSFTDTDMHLNPDGDHRINMMEFAFGTDPTLMDMGPLATDGSRHGDPVSQADAEGQFWLYFIRRIDGSLTYTPCFSGDLAAFHDNDNTGNPLVVVGTTSVIADYATGDYELVKVPFPASLPDGKAAKFGCVRVDVPEP